MDAVNDRGPQRALHGSQPPGGRIARVCRELSQLPQTIKLKVVKLAQRFAEVARRIAGSRTARITAIAIVALAVVTGIKAVIMMIILVMSGMYEGATPIFVWAALEITRLSMQVVMLAIFIELCRVCSLLSQRFF
ncbi:MAG: hypothetical protein LBD34_02745 [Puniceicoccales bacterium]|jgi:hypothetical protein|nr:hypothetical protein [Puniceicoccales bacterium]